MYYSDDPIERARAAFRGAAEDPDGLTPAIEALRRLIASSPDLQTA